MKTTLTILEPANNDIQDAFDWYRMQSEFAAAYLIERLEEALKHICESPLIYPKVHAGFRQIVLNPFPYVLIYSVKENNVIVYRLWAYQSQSTK